MPDAPQDQKDRFEDLFLFGLGAVVTLVVILVIVFARLHADWGAAFAVAVWGVALLVAGFGLGFLFGIPKVLQQQASTDAAQSAGSRPRSYQLRINTNLEEISDWLTKIIVGLGLTELRTMPRRVGVLSSHVARCMASSANDVVASSVGIAMAIFFPVAGFLIGYLTTRLFIQGAFARADIDAFKNAGALDTMNVRLFNLEATAETLAPSAAPTGMAAVVGVVDDQLRSMAAEYMQIDASNYQERVSQKNSSAARMAKYVIAHGISRDALARETDEGLIMALASAVQTATERGDTQRLLSVADKVTRLHVKFRIALAFGKVLQMEPITDDQRRRVLAVLAAYRVGADKSLLGVLDGVERSFRGGAD